MISIFKNILIPRNLSKFFVRLSSEDGRQISKSYEFLVFLNEYFYTINTKDFTDAYIMNRKLLLCPVLDFYFFCYACGFNDTSFQKILYFHTAYELS